MLPGSQEILHHSSLCTLRSCQVGEDVVATVVRRGRSEGRVEGPAPVLGGDSTGLRPSFPWTESAARPLLSPVPGARPVAVSQGPVCRGFRHLLSTDASSSSNISFFEK